MATFKPVKVTKPFHLSLEEYKKLFPEFTPRKRCILVVALDPIQNLTITINQSKEDKQKVIQSLSTRGFKVIRVGSEVEDIKEGNLVFMPNQHAVSYALKRDIIINDVFPRVRTYTMMMFDDHNVPSFIEDLTEGDLIETEQEANIDMEEKQYQEALKEIKDNDSNPNKF